MRDRKYVWEEIYTKRGEIMKNLDKIRDSESLIRTVWFVQDLDYNTG